MKPLRYVGLTLLIALLVAGCAREAIHPMEAAQRVVLQTPVPGLKLFVFNTGRMPSPAWGVYSGGGLGKIRMDQPAFLISHPTAGMLLYEAGFHPDIAKNPSEHIGWFVFRSGLLNMQQDAGQDARSQVLARGISLIDIKSVVVSHFHPEHVGAVELFPESEIVADRNEIDYAIEDPKYNFLRREYDEVRTWRPLDFDPNNGRFGGFPAYIDWFGDGSVIIVSSPGHTPGHVSVFLNLQSGPLLLAGDVAWRLQNIETQSIGLPFISVTGEGARRSLGVLLAFAAANPEVLIVPGHDLNPLRAASRPDVVMHEWDND